MYVLEEVTNFFFIMTNLSYFKRNDILHTLLNVYKIFAKDQQVVDS